MLPTAKRVAADPGSINSEKAIAEMETRKGLRFLLVEDNPLNQMVEELILVKMGFAVEIADNGTDALEQLAAKEFDVVLMDCQMPVLNGFDTARRIRAGTVPGINPCIPIIAVTTYARTEDQARCIEAGMNDAITKPIQEAELMAALGRLKILTMPGVQTQGIVSSWDQGILDMGTLEMVGELRDPAGKPLLPQMVQLYLSDEAACLHKMDRLFEVKGAEELGQQAHSFGGNAASIGGIEVRHIALELEAAALALKWPAVKAHLNELRRACGRLNQGIDRLNLTKT